MAIELYNYQLEAIEKLKNGSILCGGVGSGKSRTSIAYYFKECGGVIDGTARGYEHDYGMMTKPVDLYIITTARKRDTREWEGELTPFLLSTDIDISAYDTKVVVDSWNNISKYVDVEDSFFIFDEQRVVGSGTWVKSFLKITKRNRWILLSATPGDTWSDYIPVFIANGFYKNRTEFLRRHAIYSYYTQYPKIEKYIEQGRLVRCRNEILVNMDYSRPTVTHHENLLVEYDAVSYKALIQKRWNFDKNKPVENPSELFYLMRKIINSDTSRVEAVIDILKKKQKIIVFYNFDYELDILKNADYGEGVKVAEWNGHKHEPIPQSDSWVYLVQYTAGCEGWNCIKTDTLIFYSQSYSYKAMVQAAGRIDRLNTPFKDLYYYHLVSNSSIDIAIQRALRSKRNFNESGFKF